MAVAWPPGAPQFAERWEEQDDPLTVRTNMDVGPPKVRRRSTRNTRQIQVTFIGTHAQWLILKDFHRVSCQGGVEFHTFLHPYENTVQNFRFVNAPSISNIGPLGITMNCVWEQL